jgi:hypothetical protein
MDRSGIKYTTEEVKYLVDQIEKLKPFPEVPAALEKLHTKYKLVVLSNGDPDMLETAKQYHKIPFDRVIMRWPRRCVPIPSAKLLDGLTSCRSIFSKRVSSFFE